MSKTRWKEIETTFQSLQDLPEKQRLERLKELSKSDPTLHDEVAALFFYHENDESWLEESVRDKAMEVLVEKERQRLPEIRGGYRITSLLAQGGMGTVYLADQLTGVQRTVALKVMNSQDEQFLNRFTYERQVLALLLHPHIAQVYDSGHTTDGYPFLAMELVKGKDILTYCDEERLSISKRLHLFIAVCEGVAHAHRKGVIHCDLKPYNILVGEGGIPKIIDFGIAQNVAPDGEIKNHGWTLGTPAYMGPECIDGSVADTTADVYALGVVLYELLCGYLPLDDDVYRDSTKEQIGRLIKETSLTTPFKRVPEEHREFIAKQRGTDVGRWRRVLNSDLNWIVEKALSPEPSLRYSSVDALVRDIFRYFDGKPVEAHPPSFGYVLKKYLTRYKRATVAVSSFLLAVLFAVTSLYGGKYYAQQLIAQQENVIEVMKGILEEANPRTIKDPDDIQGFLEKAKARISNTKDPHSAGILYWHLGQAIVGWRDWDEAIVVFDDSIRHCELALDENVSFFRNLFLPKADRRQIQIDLNNSRVSKYLARIWSTNGISNDFIEELHLFRNQLEKDGFRDLYLKTSRVLGDAYYILGDFDQAEIYFLEYFDSDTLDSEVLLAALNNYGNMLLARGDKAKAGEIFSRAVAVCQQMGFDENNYQYMQAYNGMGVYLIDVKRLDEAKEYVMKAYEWRMNILGPDNQETLDSWHNRLRWYGRQEPKDLVLLNTEYPELLSAKKRMRPIDSTSIIETYNNYADFLKNTGEHEVGIKLIDEAQTFMKKEGLDIDPHFYILLTKAEIYEEIGEYENAHKMYTASNEARKRIKSMAFTDLIENKLKEFKSTISDKSPAGEM